MEKLLPTVAAEEINRIVNCEEANPSSVLGPHFVTSDRKLLSIRAYLPRAEKVWLKLEEGEKSEFVRVDPRGFWEARFPAESVPRYTITFEDRSGYLEEREDPYSFGPQLGEIDLYLLGEGTHRKLYDKLGAHIVEVGGVRGTLFAVWAPNAKAVSIEADFNHWQTGEAPMNTRGASGVWEIFVPRVGEGEVYKFAIKSKVDDKIHLKADPFAFRTEVRPRTASKVATLEDYHWTDQDWLASKNEKFDASTSPVSVYELHLGSWKKAPDGSFLNYREIADELVPYLKDLGFTHVELMPVMEHPLDDSWGYQIVNYYAPTSRYGTPEDFMYFVDRCHRGGIGVILDWVPAHFPKDDYGLALFDGTHLYEHADPRQGVQPDWGTLIFNYSRNEVRAFLICNALFWLDKYHTDGLRLDAVASMLYLDYSRNEGEWVPNQYGGRENLGALEFLRETNEVVHALFPKSLTIAEESTAWPGVTRPVKKGGLGFDLKWNMGWMHDTLVYFQTDPLFRKYHQRDLTFSLLYAFSEKFVLVFSHDEVVYGKRSMEYKMPGDEWQRFANLRLLLGYLFTHPGKKLIFMGTEFGQRNEWNFRTELDWKESENPLNKGVTKFLRNMNHIYSQLGEFFKTDFNHQGFEWIDFKDSEQSTISFMRMMEPEDEGFSLVVCNMTPVPRQNYRVGVPVSGYYREIVNSDAKEYGGSGVGNLGGVTSEEIPWHGRPHSLRLTLPPLAILILKPEKTSGSV
jgi:1,4-alpha-glucan branching enzyme